MSRLRLLLALLFICSVVASVAPIDAATIVIVNKDPANVGFNDPTAAAPVGGNTGTTLGQQRLNVFNAAALIWGAKLTSNITIKIAANFGPLTPCSATEGILGHAGPTDAFGNFANAPRADTWYPVALASALSNEDKAAGETDGASITAEFNSNIGTADCLTGTSWYLGLDGNHGTKLDLETVLLHEFGHGLGFLPFVNVDTGALAQGYPDVFSVFMLDNAFGMHWPAMTDAQRLSSETNDGGLVFDGPATTAAAALLTAGKDSGGHPLLYAPTALAKGSSISHFDISATPNQLMEPYINDNLTHNVDVPYDLTAKAFVDLGWHLAAASCPAITLSPASLPAGTQSVAYNQTISAAGGTAAYTYAVTAGTLPTGVNLAANGTLAGTPTQRGTFNITITATDAAACTGSKAYSLVISCPTITLSPAGGTTLSVTNGAAYSRTITAAGGTGAYSYAVTTGALPAGLTLSAAGLISGTTTAAGNSSITVTATDANGCTGTANYTVSVSSGGGGTCTPGDANGDHAVTPADVFYTINYLFAGGPAPQSLPPTSWMKSADDLPVATLSLGTASASPAGRIVVPVILRGVAELDGLSFRIDFGVAAIRSVAIRRAGALGTKAALLEAWPRTATTASYLLALREPAALAPESVVAELEIELSPRAANAQNVTLVFDREATSISDRGRVRLADSAHFFVEDGSIRVPKDPRVR